MMLKLNEIIPDSIKAGLKELGFKQKRNTFQKSLDQFVLVLDFWNSTWNRENEKLFWFEIGVYSADFYEFMFGENAPASVRSNYCSVNLNNGPLLKKGVSQHCYHLTPDNLLQVQEELKADFASFVFPFLKDLSSLEDLLKFKELDPVYCDRVSLLVGFGLAKNNELDKAGKLINTYLNSAKFPVQWVKRIVDECNNLNVNLDIA